MSFKMFRDILHWSKNDLFGWANTWQGFLDGRWFSVCGYRWPNSWDDNTGRYNLHPATGKKVIREGLAEQVDYAEAGEHWGRGNFKHYPQIKLRLTQKGQDLMPYVKIQAEDEVIE